MVPHLQAENSEARTFEQVQFRLIVAELAYLALLGTIFLYELKAHNFLNAAVSN